MRALGPGSVSSILKIILDVVYLVLWVAAAGVTLAGVAILLLSFEPEIFNGSAVLDRFHIQGHWLGPAVLILLVLADGWFAGAIVIVARLRRIFASLTAGDPFQPANVRRLRVIALTMAALEIGRSDRLRHRADPLPQPRRAALQRRDQPVGVVLDPGHHRARRGVPRRRPAAARGGTDHLRWRSASGSIGCWCSGACP